MVTTAVDTNVLLDVFLADVEFADDSLAALDQASSEGDVVLAPIVVAELAAAFPGPDRARRELSGMSVRLPHDVLEEAIVAGQLWRRRTGTRGQRRTRVLPDYLVVAHASLSADRLLTRDAQMGRLGVRGLKVVTPRQLLGLT